MFTFNMRSIGIGLVIFLAARSSHTLEAQSANPVRVVKGTKLALDLDTPISSATTREGDAVLFRARNDIKVHDRLAIPRGTLVKGTAIQVTPAFVNGKPRRAEMRIRLDEISFSGGQVLPLKAVDLILNSEIAGQSVLTSVLQGSASQAMTGGLLGGLVGRSSRSAGIGAVAAIGIGAVAASKRPRILGSDITLPREAILETHLELSLDIPQLALSAGTPALSPLASVVGSAPDASLPPLVPIDAQPTVVPTIDATVDDRASLPAPVPSNASGEVASATPVETAGAFTLSVEVNRVLIDAMVRDRAGNPMTNLRKEDFRLFEDGVEQPIQDFSRDELPLAVALVIDRSGSVAPLMSRIQNAAFQALQQLKHDDAVCLISFAADVELLEELTTDRTRIASRIGGIHAGGGTGIVDALNDALNYLARTAPDRRRAVILISDNLEGHSRTSLDQVIHLASESDAVVYSVKIGQSAVSSFPLGVPIPSVLTPRLPAPTPVFDPLPAITKETGGEMFSTNATALDAALASAIATLKLRYTLSYNPANSSKRIYHGIEVRLTDRLGRAGWDYTVHSRSGYFGGKVGQ